MGAPAQEMLAFAIRGPIGRDDLPGLCDRVCMLLGEHKPTFVECDVAGVEPDAVTVDALARLELAARSYSCHVHLRGASRELVELVAFMGLENVLREPMVPPMAELAIREAGPADLAFLREMLYEASFAMNEPKPPREAIAQPEIVRYLPVFDRAGDRALVAELDGRPVGAAWYRLFPKRDPGYGFVDANTPELSIAVAPDARRRGIGKALLERLLDAACRDGFDAVSLSVARSNAAAIALYERCGFEVVARDEAGDALTMRGEAS